MLDDTYARATCRSPVDLVAAHVFDLLRDLRLISERIEEEEHAVSVVLIERFVKDGQSALSSPFIDLGKVIDFEQKGYTQSWRSCSYEAARSSSS
jgi:hypothetical protein